MPSPGSALPIFSSLQVKALIALWVYVCDARAMCCCSHNLPTFDHFGWVCCAMISGVDVHSHLSRRKVFLTCGLNCKAFLTSSTSCPRSFFSTTEKRSVSCDIFSRPHLKQEIVLINFVSTIENVSKKWVHIRKILILGCHSVRRTSFFGKGTMPH